MALLPSVMINEIVDMIAMPVTLDQTNTFEDAQMLGYSRLGNTKDSGNSINT